MTKALFSKAFDALILKIYQSILWCLGFKKGEYITYMLKRTETRLGVFWWFLFTATVYFGSFEIWHFLASWLKIIVTVLFLGLVSVLAWHVSKAKVVNGK